MARAKRGSRTLERAQKRLAGIQSIDPELVLDGGISAANYAKNIKALRQQLDSYNRYLSTIDSLQNRITDTERELANYSERMLIGVAAKYGKNSSEYEMAGGVRKQDKKRPRRQSAASGGSLATVTA